MWRVRWHEAGRVRRKFFGARDTADNYAAQLRGELVTKRRTLAALPPAEQAELLLVHEEAKRRGVSLASLLTLLTSAPDKPSAPALADVMEELTTAKRNAGRARSYLKSLGQIVANFAKGRERMPVDLFTVRDLEKFLNDNGIRYRKTLRTRLSTLFKFAVRRGYRADNPCNQLETITAPPLPIEVLTVNETVKCMGWFKDHPRAMAWFVLSAFCGLRPMEAQKTRWSEIHFKEGWIRVEAQTTKMRQRRVVYPLPVALAWLRKAKRRKSELPLTTKQRTVELRELRAVLGWDEWKQDVTRHSAASYWLSTSGSAANVATALGNSESILRRDYMALVTKADAEKYWAIA